MKKVLIIDTCDDCYNRSSNLEEDYDYCDITDEVLDSDNLIPDSCPLPTYNLKEVLS